MTSPAAPAQVPPAEPGTARAQTAFVERRTGDIKGPWIRSQGINVTRHAAALRPFRAGEFGTGPAAPSEGHLQAVNALMMRLRRELLAVSAQVREEASAAAAQPSTSRLQELVTAKHRAHDWVRAIEQIWDYYFELAIRQEDRRVMPWDRSSLPAAGGERVKGPRLPRRPIPPVARSGGGTRGRIPMPNGSRP